MYPRITPCGTSYGRLIIPHLVHSRAVNRSAIYCPHSHECTTTLCPTACGICANCATCGFFVRYLRYLRQLRHVTATCAQLVPTKTPPPRTGACHRIAVVTVARRVFCPPARQASTDARRHCRTKTPPRVRIAERRRGLARHHCRTKKSLPPRRARGSHSRSASVLLVKQQRTAMWHV